ncbi:ABC transporter permease [Dethiosulfatarculus sandiegensis]|uniref:Glutathione ABC transporter permease n=1 Tax=Dethiosulfatarculus sandiegensis TaxID=1429043 RepID=A0A0D2GLL3_9BACT|nr:ABC transporter permease [Dethiosulfatarculus sandiegensis]KIX15537.1 glutathione ABC transporter permease [Dethiosulfatarculus sandiegensis]
MVRYILNRLFQSVLMLLGITLVIFVITNVLGDPAALLVDDEFSKEEQLALRHEIGLDQPLMVQYFRFVEKAVQGDFGQSLQMQTPAFELVWEHLPATVELSLAAIFFAVLFAIPLGIASAVKPYSVLDRVLRVLALSGQAAPGFWLGIMAILFFGVKLKLLPISGRGGWEHLIMPAATLGFYALAAIMRLTRSAMLDVLDKDYIRTARIKGVHEKSVVLKHALKNALVPVITIVSLFMGRLLGGAVVTETIFAWPGMGRLAIGAIQTSDFPVVQAAVFLMSLFFILINLLVDILYSFIDPRITYN